MKKNNFFIGTAFLFFVIFSLVMTGCGGGGDNDHSSATPPPAEVLTGNLSPAVEGMSFETATQSGVTDANGAFKYEEGELVNFFVGDAWLGEVEGSEDVDFFALVGIDVPVAADFKTVAKRQFYWGFATGVMLPKNIDVIIPVVDGMNAVANISVLLQTLDSDSDLSNGIQIPAEAAELATGVDLNLEQDALQFFQSPKFCEFIAKCREDGVWGGTKAIVNPGIALNALYAELGIEIQVPVWSVTKNGAGDVRTYDEAGNILSREYDSGRTIDFTVNGNGDITKMDDDGKITNLTYDANGNIATATFKDGTVVNFAYDAGGRLISSTYKDVETTYTRDEFGRIVEVDTDGGSERSISYDDNDNVLKVEWDSGAYQNYVYDEMGRVVKIAINDSPEAKNTQEDLVYDELGLKKSSKTFFKFSGYIYEYTYTSDAKGVSGWKDNGGNTTTIETVLTKFGFFGPQIWANGIM